MSKYKKYSIERLEEHFSHYLINSWSYSKVTSFARNEKAFEMGSIFGIYNKNSVTTVTGSAYHEALKYYWQRKKEGFTAELIELEQQAFDYLENVKPNYWKLGKKTPTVETCQKKASELVSDLLKNFLQYIYVYEEDIAEVLDVELYFDEFLSINGVDIPLPCHAKVDLIVRTKSGKIAIVDHKTKTSFTPDDEVALSIGIQAITYVKCFESKTGTDVDEVWFIENKASQNKDKSQQVVPFKVVLDDNNRRLYEALLYEPLKRMIEAVNDPDYTYLINQSDNLADKAELYDFWARTMVCEVEDFNVEESKKHLVSQRLKKIRDATLDIITPNVIKKFRECAAEFIQYDLSNTNMTQAEKIEHVLRTFGTIVKVAHSFEGYSSVTYLLEISAGVRISSVYGYRLDLANALDVASVRISNELVVYNDKSYLSVEISKKRDRDLLFDPVELHGRRIPIGKDNFGKLVVWDLDNHSTPHVLICGATGSGKSVCINSTIEYVRLAGVDRIVILDPKHEFKKMKKQGIEVYNTIEDIEDVLDKLVKEMNVLIERGIHERILVVFDEFADALAQSRKGNDLKIYGQVQVGAYKTGEPKFKRVQTGEHKSLEENLRILLQKGRSTGFRIMAALQRASVKVITGDAKVNFPVQICFMVPKEADSRVVIDEPGAEMLSGKGDGLMKSPEYKDTVRFQAFYKS